GSTYGSLGRGSQNSDVPRQKEVTEIHGSCRGIPKVQKGFSTIVIACQQQRNVKKQKNFRSQSALPTLPAMPLSVLAVHCDQPLNEHVNSDRPNLFRHLGPHPLLAY